MTIAQEINSYANALFDVVGAGQQPDGARLLIVGLESTPKRNLDEFHRVAGKFQITGFERHAKPKLESLLAFIHKQGFAAELAGRCGYPLRSEIKLKEAAVCAGLGTASCRFGCWTFTYPSKKAVGRASSSCD